MAKVELDRITKQFGDTLAVRDVSFTVDDGEFVVLVGPSGCGKTTVLRMIAGLEEITAGELRIDGIRENELAPSARSIAMVFQSYALYPHMTVYKNLGFSLKISGVPKAEIDTAVRRAAAVLQIEHLLQRFPSELSGGQRQRVAIGRAITRKPKVFLFDEPLSNVDADLRVRMRVEFARLHQELAATMIYVTHDQIEAMTLADRIVVFSNGRVEQVGEPLELYERPANQFVAGFIGSPRMNFLEGRLVEKSGKHAVVELACGARITAAVDAEQAATSTVTLGVRPESLEIGASDANTLPVVLRQTEHTGDATLFYADIQGSTDSLVGRVAGSFMGTRGSLVAVTVRESACHVFDQNGIALRRVGATRS